MHYIYSLTDPRNSNVVYIGQSNFPARRYAQHLLPEARGRFKKGRWVSDLINLGLKPIMKIIWECHQNQADFWECLWIAMYRAAGYDLMNATNGGASINSKPQAAKTISDANANRIVSAETRKKMGDARRGRKHTAATKAKIGKAHLGKTRTPDAREKLSHSLKGKPSPKGAEWRKKNLAILIARNKSPQMREVSRRNGLKRKGTKDSPERIEQKRQWMTGRKHHTDEFKKALAERNKTRKYNPEKARENARRMWDDPIKGPEMRAALAERNRKRKRGNEEK